MPFIPLYFVPLASLRVTEGKDASGNPTGPLFPGDLLQGDTGNPAAAGGGGGKPTTLTLTGDARTLRIRDDDARLDDDLGINQDTNSFFPQANQTVVGGTAGFAAGSLVQVQYGYTLRGSDGSKLDMHAVSVRPADTQDSADNTVAGIVATGMLVPGVTYRVTAVKGHAPPAYTSLVNCFSAGTMIATADGEVAVEALRPGDLVCTRDRGLQPIRWIGARTLDAAELALNPRLRPVRIRAGALGPGTPRADLVVSPQHRVLVRSKVALRMFGAEEVLVAARQLLALDGIEVADDIARVTYLHFIFDRHEVVFSNGAATESLYPGSEALKAIGPAAREELFAIFPQLREGEPSLVQPARLLTGGRQARQLALRHFRNRRPLAG